MNKIVSDCINECLNNKLLQHFFIKKQNMTFTEKEEICNNFSRMIGYCILFKETDGILEYMSLKSEGEQIQYLRSKVAAKLGIPQDKIEERLEEITNYTFENFIAKGYVFHAGNSKAILDNMNNGLRVSKGVEEEKKEMVYIASIYAKYGAGDPFGWGTLDFNNKRNGWFYDNVPDNMLYYANSPEWFNQFCGVNHAYAWGVVPEENRHGYANRDYEICLSTIKTLIEKYNMDESDKEQILAFFNKCWKKFADSEPCLLLVPNTLIFSEISVLRNTYKKDEIFKDVINGGCKFTGFNICCNLEIDKEYLSYVNLSPILPRIKIGKSTNEREITIEECIKKLNGLDIEHLVKVQEMLSLYLEESNRKEM